MIFGIYTRPDGAYLLVPECMQPSVEAEKLHGPLKFLELMDWCEEPLPDIWTTVMTSLDEHSFVLFQDAAATYLSETEVGFRLRKRCESL